MGVLHVMRGKSRQVADLIPVDYVCNTILTAAWHTALNPPGRRIPIFHSASSGTPPPTTAPPPPTCASKRVGGGAGKNPTDWWTIITVGIQWFRRNPIKHELKQFPFAFVVHNYWLFLMAHILLHTTPAAVGDVLRMLQGRNAKLVAGSNHLYTVITQLAPFTSRQWQFLADNVDTKLLASMSAQDKNIFEIEVRKIDWEIYAITLVRAAPMFFHTRHTTHRTTHTTHDTHDTHDTRTAARTHGWCVVQAKGLVQFLLKEELTNNLAAAILEKKKFTAAL
jgi:fatty acyl-CoA reductase